MQVNMVSCNLSLIANPYVMHSPPMDGSREMKLYDGSMCLAVKVKRMGIGKSGNVKNARWRNPRGGSWLSPVSKKRNRGH